MIRGFALLLGLLVAAPAIAGELLAQDARHFVVGKLFSYNCFEGTRGVGRVHANGAVSGSIQFQGRGPVRHASLPPGTLRVRGGMVCASLRGLPVQPCFHLQQLDRDSFRGSIRGLGFAYCDFNRRYGRMNVADGSAPVSLRPSLAEIK